MPTIETIVKPRGNRITVPVPKEFGSYSFQVILVPLRPDTPPLSRSARRVKRGKPSLADVLLSPAVLDGDRELDTPRTDDPPSSFERSGGFSSEAYA